MKNVLRQTILIAIFVFCLTDSRILASTVQPDKALVESEARQIDKMITNKNMDELLTLLAKGTFPSKVKVATYLKDYGDRRALPELERANRQFGGWNLRTPCDDRSGIFPLAIWKITTKDLPESEKIDALFNLLEARGPIVPKMEIYDTVIVNGVEQKHLRVIRPNYFVGLCGACPIHS